ncbi:MAG TPA: N-acetyltransferase, partial [Acidimicrobiales bacterium]
EYHSYRRWVPLDVRTATAADHESILRLVQAAFASDDRDGREEIDIVMGCWALATAPDGLELVAIDEGLVVGHVLAARGRLDGREALAIAPLAVSPARQGEGIGTMLMQALLRRAEHAGWPFVLLLGSPDYYGRFGFESSGPCEITYVPVGAGNPHFQIRRFAGYDPSYRGRFEYCWETELGSTHGHATP